MSPLCQSTLICASSSPLGSTTQKPVILELSPLWCDRQSSSTVVGSVPLRPPCSLYPYKHGDGLTQRHFLAVDCKHKAKNAAAAEAKLKRCCQLTTIQRACSFLCTFPSKHPQYWIGLWVDRSIVLSHWTCSSSVTSHCASVTLCQARGHIGQSKQAKNQHKTQHKTWCHAGNVKKKKKVCSHHLPL